jgi:diphthamide synthase (EF-2-diphthine--ammonia ligase)
LGQELDAAAVDRLKALSRTHRFNVAGEGGEYETFVVDAPFFAAPVEITDSETVWKRDVGTYHIRAARLGKRRAA